MSTLAFYLLLAVVAFGVYVRFIPKGCRNCTECRRVSKLNRESKYRFGDMQSEELHFCHIHNAAPFFPEK